MASILLERVWLTLASDTSQSLALLTTGDKSFVDAISGEVRSYAAGRERLITTPTRKIGVQVSVAIMPKEYATLNAWAGQVVLYRDENGTRLWSVYLGTPWKSLVTYGTSWRQVDLAIQAVTYSEAV